MNNKQQNDYLARENIFILMRKYSLPCIISLLVGALYNIVDQIFIANASYLGSYGNAANTVVFPLTVIALAVAVMIGDGCCAFVSINLGKKDFEKARKSIGNSVTITIISSLIITLIYLIFSQQILILFGGKVNNETFMLSREYFFYISLGIPFYMFGQGLNPVIRADGSPKFAMISTLLGAFTNVILDPVFIFIFHMGMKGAAIATVLGQILTCGMSVWYMFHLKNVKLNKSDFTLDLKIISSTLTLGICSFLSQAAIVVSMAVVNNMILKYCAFDSIFSKEIYSQIPMAVVGIVMKFFQIVISISIGMAAGVIPIVGYNMGVGLNKRVKKILKYLLIGEIAIGSVAFIIAQFFPYDLIKLFGSGNESIYYTTFAVKAFRIYLSFVILSCINKASFIFLQAMGKALLSTSLSLIREIVFGVGFAVILPKFFGLDGILYSMPVSEIFTFMFSVAVIISTNKELENKYVILNEA